MPNDANTLATNLKRMRLVSGLTQAQLAKRAGLSRVGYANIERAISSPRVSTLRRLATALNVSVFKLVEKTVKLKVRWD